jgi:hypothetical protein
VYVALGRGNVLITQTAARILADWSYGNRESEKRLKLTLKFKNQTQSPRPSSCHQINKVMVTLEQAMKAHRRRRGIDLLFL